MRLGTFGVFCVIIGIVIISSVQKIEAYMLGIAQSVPGKVQGLKDYRGFIQSIHDDLPTMTFEEFKRREQIKLKYELNITQVAEDVLVELDKKNMIGR